MNKIAQYLNRYIVGNVFDKKAILEKYSTDRSILKITPKLVAIPENTSDICRILKFSNKLAAKNFKLPVTVRGSGNDKTGAAIGDSIILSMEKMNKVQEIDFRSRLVRVQAGITLGELNTALSLYGLTLPIAADENETIGGLINNNKIDDKSIKYGGIFRYVERAEIVLANGEIIKTGKFGSRILKQKSQKQKLEYKIYRELDKISETDKNTATRNRFDLAGYPNLSLIKKSGNFDILPVFFGSQGTLGIISEVILSCVVIPKKTEYIMVNFNNATSIVSWLKQVKTLKPVIANLYDARIFRETMEFGEHSNILAKKATGEYVAIVGFDNSKRQSLKKIKKTLEYLPKRTAAIIEDATNSEDFQELDGLLSGYLNNTTKGERAPIIDDVRIKSERLENYLLDIKKAEQELKTALPVFGSFLTENYCVRPNILFDTEGKKQFILNFLKIYREVIRTNEGFVNGGTPEGRVKAMITPTFENSQQIYLWVKNTFDKNNILNPDIKLGADLKTTVKYLRDTYNNYVVNI